MLNLNIKSKEEFFKKNPDARKNWYKEVLEDYFDKPDQHNDREKKEIRNIIEELSKRKLKFSNDHQIEIKIKRIYKSASLSLKWTILKFFFGKTDNRIAEAYAYKEKDGFIAISLGFSNIFDILPIQLILFDLYEYIKHLEDPTTDLIKSDLDLCLDKLLYFIENQFDNNYYDKDIILKNWKYLRDQNIKEYVDLPIFVNHLSIYYFVLLHEIGHHHLGHLKYKKKVQKLFPDFVNDLNTKLINELHLNEFQSDSFALLTLIKLSKKNFNLTIEDILTGSILTMIGISFLSGDITKASSTHPSVLSRIELQCKIMDYYGIKSKINLKQLLPYIDYLSRNVSSKLDEIIRILT